MLTKMTDTFDIQINNTFRTKFAHQRKFISALHAIIPINNSMQHYLFSSLELRCWVFFFFGNSHNGCYESQILQELRMLPLIALWDITLNVTFQDLEQGWEYRPAIYHQKGSIVALTWVEILICKSVLSSLKDLSFIHFFNSWHGKVSFSCTVIHVILYPFPYEPSMNDN